jgi:hypothetical protein
MAKTGRNTISVDQHLNTCWNLKFQPGQKPNPHLKFLFQFKPRLYLKYNLTFKYEIKLEVLSQFKCNGQQTAWHLDYLKTSSLISYLNVKLYFKYSLSLNWNRNFKCEFGFCPGWNRGAGIGRTGEINHPSTPWEMWLCGHLATCCVPQPLSRLSHLGHINIFPPNRISQKN